MTRTLTPQPEGDNRKNEMVSMIYNLGQQNKNLNQQTKNLSEQMDAMLGVMEPMIEQKAKEAVKRVATEQLTPMIDEVKEVANSAVEKSRADTSHQHDVTMARHAKASHLTKQWIRKHHGDVNYGGREYYGKKHTQFMVAIARMLITKFHIQVVNDVRQGEFKEVMKWIPTITLNDIAAWRVEDRLTTLDVLNKWEKRHGIKLTTPND